MSDRLPAGPYRTLSLNGEEFPYYIIPFDKRGVCQAPETRGHLLGELADGGYSDVFLFSHGWNNDWAVATDRYQHFLEGYMKMRRERNLPMPDGYKPLLVGIFWPSTLLVFTAKEKGPEMASGQPAAVDEAVAEERGEVAELAAALEPDAAEELYRLTQKQELDEDEARRLAVLLLPIFQGADGELGDDEDFGADDLLEVWRSTPGEDDLDEFIAGDGGGPQEAGIGGFLKKLDPRKIVRTATVYLMKDRAGRVGAHGVSPLLRDILAGSSARVHLIGHSYGGKVVLSATAVGGKLPRPVQSMLLLQPAVSHLSFADRVPATDPQREGGYRAVLSRVENPIFSTYSEHDFALTQLFHRAVRRKGDLGEAEIAAAGGKPPSKYAALGGFGPRRAGERLIEIQEPGASYDFSDGAEIYGLDGSRGKRIPGHGGISNPHTWWALYSLASL